MPESGPFTLLILSFTVFSFVAWQLRSRNALKLGFSAGVLMLAVAGRILLQQIVSIIQVVVQGSDPTIPVFDGLLVAAFLVLLSWTAMDVLTLAVTADPAPPV